MPLTVVIEVKPGYDMFTLAQLGREVVDVAHATRARRIACVMVGADLAAAASGRKWEEGIRAFAAAHLPFVLDVSPHYSSFAALGRVVADPALEQSEWARYADDMTAQLRRKGLMGYGGAPMFDDLAGLTVPNTVEVFNRAIRWQNRLSQRTNAVVTRSSRHLAVIARGKIQEL
jgi:hypothetical protein